MPRKYRDERNSRRNRRWLQDEMDASGPLLDDPAPRDDSRQVQQVAEPFERGDLETWPRGIYARAWVRGYASVIGLDPIDTVDEFCKLFPQGDRRAEGTFRDFAAIIAHAST